MIANRWRGNYLAKFETPDGETYNVEGASLEQIKHGKSAKGHKMVKLAIFCKDTCKWVVLLCILA